MANCGFLRFRQAEFFYTQKENLETQSEAECS